MNSARALISNVEYFVAKSTNVWHIHRQLHNVIIYAGRQQELTDPVPSVMLLYACFMM